MHRGHLEDIVPCAMDQPEIKNISRVLMAVAHILGAWDGEMRIPPPSRKLIVAMKDHHWELDESGYPLPSDELIAEIESLRGREN